MHTFGCPRCHAPITVADDAEGFTGCAHCQARVVIPPFAPRPPAPPARVTSAIAKASESGELKEVDATGSLLLYGFIWICSLLGILGGIGMATEGNTGGGWLTVAGCVLTLLLAQIGNVQLRILKELREQRRDRHRD